MINGDKLRENLGTAQRFNDFLENLCLTDRQKEIAHYKYLRGWANADIAAELDISSRLIVKEMQVIRKVIGNAQLEGNIDVFTKSR